MSIAISGSSITFSDQTQMSTATGGSFRNRIINGDMRIDQRSAGASYAITTGAAYGSCDRWGSLAGANGVWTQFRTATTLTDLPFAMRIRRTAGSTSTAAAYIGQVIETTNCQDLAGQSITLSYYATAGANFSAASSLIYVEVWTGTGSDQGWGALNGATWTGQTLIINSAQPITTTRTRYSVTAAVPSGVNEIAIRFSAFGTGTAGASDFFQILGVQLEQGSTATEFERRPIGTELALCQRYYEQVGGSVGDLNAIALRGYQLVGSYLANQYMFPVQKRVAPTTTISGTFAVANCGQPIVLNADTKTWSFQTLASATNAIVLYSNNSGLIQFSAEL